MVRFAKLILAGSLGITAIAACTQESARSFYSEAGGINDVGFGNATMNNTLVQSGERDFVLNLAKRFAEEVDSTVTFAFNSAVLDASARQTLLKQAHWIAQFPEVRFKVYGHTDLVGSNSYNYRLGCVARRPWSTSSCRMASAVTGLKRWSPRVRRSR